MKRRAFLASAGLTAAGVAGCLGRSDADPGPYDVGMSAERFLPGEFAVSPGTTVVWRNTGSRTHTVTAYESGLPEGTSYFASGGFDSEEAARNAWLQRGGGSILGGQTFEHTFEEPGRYEYFCVPHEVGGMVGTVVVTPDATRTPR